MVQHVYSIARIRLGKESLSKTHTINNNDFLGSLVDSSLGSKVVGTGSLDSGLVDGDNGSVGVGDQVGVQVQGAGVAVADSRDSSNGGGNGGSSDGGSSDGNGSNGGILGSPGGKVV